MLIIILSTLIGAIGGVNQTSLRKIIAYSSINHIGWILAALLTRETLWGMYLLLYTILSISIIIIFNDTNISYLSQVFGMRNLNKQLKLTIFSNFLSIGGLPPFLGFLPK